MHERSVTLLTGETNCWPGKHNSEKTQYSNKRGDKWEGDEFID